MQIWTRICGAYVSWKLSINTNDHSLDLDLRILMVSIFETFEYLCTEL